MLKVCVYCGYGTWRAVTHITGSGSGSQWYGPADPDTYQNVTYPQQWTKDKKLKVCVYCGYLEGCHTLQDPDPEVSVTDLRIRIRTQNVTDPQH
jgi:hypothetical protein